MSPSPQEFQASAASLAAWALFDAPDRLVRGNDRAMRALALPARRIFGPSATDRLTGESR
jgi:hypothetical protein